MTLFCLLWIPFVFLLWAALVPYEISISGILAIILGSLVAVVRFFFADSMDGGAFGFERWIAVAVDMVAIPVLTPLLVYALLLLVRAARDIVGAGGFALLWLLPNGILSAVQWSVEQDPLKLVLVPFLWTIIAVSVSFFLLVIKYIRNPVVIVASLLGILAVSPLSVTAYWAFYGQKSSVLCYGTLALAAAFFILSLVVSWRLSEHQKTQDAFFKKEQG